MRVYWQSRMQLAVGFSVLSMTWNLAAQTAGLDATASESSKPPQQTSTAIDDDLSLRNLLNLAVTVATKTARPLDEAPSSITVITRDDIARNMCRDLLDVINMVPGLSVTKDQNWDNSIGARGIYGFEGRSLVMIDGMQISGLYMGTFVIGDIIPMNMIERVEIIRGPGSVLYGGIAELAVINIITTDKEGAEGVKAYARYGQLKRDYGNRDIGVRYAKAPSAASPLYYSIKLFEGQAVSSNGKFQYPLVPYPIANPRNPAAQEDGYSSEKATATKGTQNMPYHHIFIGNIGYGDTEVKLFNSQYYLWQPFQLGDDSTGVYKQAPAGYEEITRNLNIAHNFKFADHWTFTPYIDYQDSIDWLTMNVTGHEVTRTKYGLNALYRTDTLEVLTGVEDFADYGKVLRNDNDPNDAKRGFYKSKSAQKSDTVTVGNKAAFTGITYFWQNYSASAGVRYDDNEIFGNATSPRIGLTGKSGALRGKLIYSEAFRAPLIGNNVYDRYGINPAKPWRDSVGPEKTKVYEMEVGYQINNHMAITTNVYDQTIDKVIEFYYDPQNSDTYSKNCGKLGTRGIEAEFKYLTSVMQATLNYSSTLLVTAAGPDYTLGTYDAYLAHHRHVLMGIPYQKGHLNLSYNLTPEYSVNLNELYLGPVATEVVPFCSSPSDTSCTTDTSPQGLTDIGLLWKKPASTSSISLTVHDIFDAGQRLTTAWVDSGTPDYYWKGREISLGTQWQF